MISTADFIHLPYTRDLTEGGIAYAVRSLPYTYNRTGDSLYDRMRKSVADAAVELAFRRYLADHKIPFDVQGATPFTEHDRYTVSLNGQRCDIKSYLISFREQIAEMKRNPQVVLNAPALVASDQNAAEGNRNSDIYLFAFLSGLVTHSQDDLQKAIAGKQPRHMIHVLPDGWVRPQKWNPLGPLVLKSDAEETQFIEIGGQDAGREMRSLEVELPPNTRIQLNNEFCSVAYIHIRKMPAGRIGIHCPRTKGTHIVELNDWGNIWVYGMDILLAGYLRREEFNRRATFLREGARVFQYEQTRTKNLAVNVSDLRPLSELFERVKNGTQV